MYTASPTLSLPTGEAFCDGCVVIREIRVVFDLHDKDWDAACID
jgi:hypothetical protein